MIPTHPTTSDETPYPNAPMENLYPKVLEETPYPTAPGENHHPTGPSGTEESVAIQMEGWRMVEMAERRSEVGLKTAEKAWMMMEAWRELALGEVERMLAAGRLMGEMPPLQEAAAELWRLVVEKWCWRAEKRELVVEKWCWTAEKPELVRFPAQAWTLQGGPVRKQLYTINSGKNQR